MALIESFSASLTWTGVHNALISTTQSCQQLQTNLRGFSNQDTVLPFFKLTVMSVVLMKTL